MLKIYREHSEFDEYTCFDCQTGILKQISVEDFRNFLPQEIRNKDLHRLELNGLEHKGARVYCGQQSSTHTRFPRRIYFQITRYCNLKCDYCYLQARSGLAHVPTRAVKQVARLMGREGLMEVRLTGGEPLRHPDFFEILQSFQEEHIYVSLATNGVIAKEMLDPLCSEKNLWFICSLDGDRDTHNHYRPGTFDLIIQNLKYLKAGNPDLRLRLTAVLTKHNQKDMSTLCRIGADLGAESITVIPLRPKVRNPDVLNAMVSATEFRRVIEKLLEAQIEYGIKVMTTLETDYSGKIHQDPIVRKRSSCAAGREATNLDFDDASSQFVVYGCAYSPAADFTADPEIRKPFVAGAFGTAELNRFRKIWEDELSWTIYRDLSHRSEECFNCKYWKDHRCIGSCPVQNIDYSSISVDKNVLDQLRQQLQKTAEWYCYQKVLSPSTETNTIDNSVI